MITTLLTMCLQAGVPAPVEPTPLGINLNEVREWTSDISFANVGLQAGPWRLLSDPTQFAQLDHRGLPAEPAKAIVFTGDYFYSPGIYYLVGDGLHLNGAGVVASTRNGRFYRLDGLGSVSIVAAQPPIDGYELWEARHYGESFNPVFLQRLEELNPDTVRTLNWSRIRFVGAAARQGWIPDWSQRTLPEDQRQNADAGVALEYHRQLFEALDCNGWINIPHLADETYVRNMARLFEGFSNTLYVEFSNETWNSGFPVYHWVEDNRGSLRAGEFVGLAARQAFEWWADEVDTTNVRFVAMGFTQDVSFVADQMSVLGNWVSGLGCASYFRADAGIDDPEDLVANARQNLLTRTKRGLRAHGQLAASLGVAFLGYEGGPNLFGAVGVAADGLESLGEACNEMFWTVSSEGMDLLCIYAAFRNPSPLGSYGWRPDLFRTSPKWEAAIDWNDGSPLSQTGLR